MSLLTLKGIGKIYVSEGNVAVGIRGVDLSFEKGEFVAVTGKSGSGKSTLLNIISGMDSYEEGELYIEGEPTSHYLQADWEEYREKYISFIFQDYNIIESFTVLQNVELALMHIEDEGERRRRAVELIDRVGLSSHMKHKGSKLSGGQKQRTVIARALAKDSPIILADEPTGNLDSQTSKEIIQLLREVSRDKLLIVVTHNFEQVQEFATRHIRIFDGAVESDHTVSKPLSIEEPVDKQIKKAKKNTNLKKGFTLGKAMFTAKPKLTVFICFLMIVATLGVFFSTAVFGDTTGVFGKSEMFKHIDGRVVLTKRSGEVISDSELQALADKYGAKSVLHYDLLLDQSQDYSRNIKYEFEENGETNVMNSSMRCTYGENFGKPSVGRYPESDDEVFFNLPISFQPEFGKKDITAKNIELNGLPVKLVGIKYYYDNNIEASCLLTDEGFRTATSVHYFRQSHKTLSLYRNISQANGEQTSLFITQLPIDNVQMSFDVEKGKIYIDEKLFESSDLKNKDFNKSAIIESGYMKYNEYTGEAAESSYKKVFEEYEITHTLPEKYKSSNTAQPIPNVMLHPDFVLSFTDEMMKVSYKQASIFFENDRAAHETVEKLRDEGYIAVPSDTEYSPSDTEVILGLVGGILNIVVWMLSIIFLAFFVYICSSRTLGAIKPDMAIMRSMGIPVKVIRIGIYVRMFIAMAVAVVVTAVTAIAVYLIPQTNCLFTYLYPWHYLMIFAGVILITFRISSKQVKKLFNENVKKSLKGGNH